MINLVQFTDCGGPVSTESHLAIIGAAIPIHVGRDQFCNDRSAMARVLSKLCTTVRLYNGEAL